MSRPFEPEGFSVVLRGEDRFNTWELRDGPHPLVQDQDAVGHQFVTTRRDGSGSGGSGGVAPRLGPDATAVVGTSAQGLGPRSCGYLSGRCADAVHRARVRFDDGSVDDVTIARSQATGERWFICALDSTRAPTGLDLFDVDGSLIESLELTDPRHGC